MAMVDRHWSSRNARDVQASLVRLTEHLERLARHPNDDLANAAVRVLQRISANRDALHARDFDRFYVDVMREGRSLSIAHRLREWRAVTGLTIALYHALLRRYAAVVKDQSRPNPREPSAAHRGFLHATEG
jgi:hypothetical protein